MFFFDEAHLLFDDASEAFLDSVAQTVRLIRSKGVGVFFVTQTPKDVPADVLAQLGNRVQHALRAYTPDDAKALKATVSTFPKSGLLRPRGAAHPAGHRRGGGDDPLREGRPDAGRPHEAARPRVADGAGRRRRRAPRKASPLFAKYGTRIDRESARELLAERLEQAAAPTKAKPKPKPKRPPRPADPGGTDPIADFLRSRQGQAVQRRVVRGLFGLLRKSL